MIIKKIFGKYHLASLTEIEMQYLNEQKIFNKELIFNDYFKIIDGNNFIGIILLDDAHEDRIVIDYIEMINKGKGIGSIVVQNFIIAYKRVSLIHQDQKSYNFWLRQGFKDCNFPTSDCTLLYE